MRQRTALPEDFARQPAYALPDPTPRRNPAVALVSRCQTSVQGGLDACSQQQTLRALGLRPLIEEMPLARVGGEHADDGGGARFRKALK